jgi:hypothetical protein
MNMGFAASNSASPGVGAQRQFIVQGIGMMVRVVPWAMLGLLFVGK